MLTEKPLNRTPRWSSVLPALIIPICLGMVLYLGLSAAIERELITDSKVIRYLTGHPISKITMALFLVGICSLLTIGWNVAGQIRSLNFIGKWFNGGSGNESGPRSDTDERQAEVEGAFELADLPVRYQDHYLTKRLHDVCDFAKREPSAASFEDELKYLADIDQDRKSQRYSLVRILIWATPMLGFLGTVLGISQALGGINVGPDNDFGQMMDGLRSSLFIAFDTTALALALSMVMMFGQFLVDRFETQLLQMVDHRAKHLVASRIPEDSTSISKDEIEATFVQSSEALIQKQADLWRGTIENAERAWIDSLSAANEEVQNNLTEAIDESVTNLADALGQAMTRSDEALDRRWQQWQVALSDGARQLQQQQLELNRQTNMMSRAFENSNLVQAESTESTDASEVVGDASEKQETVGVEVPSQTESVVEVETHSEISAPRASEELLGSNVVDELMTVVRMSQESWKQFQHPRCVSGVDGAEERSILKFPHNASENDQATKVA